MNTQPYLIRLGDALSQFFNVLIFNGEPNYSISTDAYRLNRPRLRRFIDFLFSPFEENHCRNSYQNDVVRAAILLNGKPPEVPK